MKFIIKSKITQLPKNPGVYPHNKERQSAKSTNFNFNSLPSGVGVYAFKKGREFLYIGKAANIRERVKQHLPSPAKRGEVGDEAKPQRPQQPAYRDNLFINQVKKVGFIKTNSEIEALILEANLIKKYQPKYNVVWRDDKNYFFIGITKEDFPRVFWTHQTQKVASIKYQVLRKKRKNILDTKYKILNTEFVGPYVDGKALKETLKVLRKVFPYRSCNKIPKRPCLWYQLGRCPAPCVLKTKLGAELLTAQIKMKRECQKNAKNLVKILQGKKKQVLKELKNEMKKVSHLREFERAAKIRNQIEALEKVLAHAKIFEPQILISPGWEITQKILQKILKIQNKISRIEAYDISNIQGQEATGSMVTFINGLPDKNFYRRFKIKISGKPNDLAMIKEVLSRRFKHREWPYPDLILIDGGIGQLNAVIKIKNQESRIKNKIKVISLAKKENKLFIENRKKPILLKSLPREIFNLILQLRDEAHRFARKYHHKLRKRALFEIQ